MMKTVLTFVLMLVLAAQTSAQRREASPQETLIRPIRGTWKRASVVNQVPPMYTSA